MNGGLNRNINLGRIYEEIRFDQLCQAKDDMDKFLARKCKRNCIKQGNRKKR